MTAHFCPSWPCPYCQRYFYPQIWPSVMPWSWVQTTATDTTDWQRLTKRGKHERIDQENP
jgi:hypothetical protein